MKIKHIYPLCVSKEQYIKNILQDYSENELFSDDHKRNIVDFLVKRVDTVLSFREDLEYKQNIFKDLRYIDKSGKHTYNFYGDTFEMLASFIFKKEYNVFVYLNLVGVELPENRSRELDFISSLTSKILTDICDANQKLIDEQIQRNNAQNSTDHRSNQKSVTTNQSSSVSTAGMSRFFTKEFVLPEPDDPYTRLGLRCLNHNSSDS